MQYIEEIIILVNFQNYLKILLEILKGRKKKTKCKDFGNLPWDPTASSMSNGFNWLKSEKGWSYWEKILTNL